MKVTVTTRHLSNNQDPERLKSYAVKKAKTMEKYLKTDKDSCEVKYVLWSEKFRDTAEISINSKNLKATSAFETTDMYTAIDSAIDIIINQLKKETDKKITSKRRGVTKSNDGTAQITSAIDSGTGKFTNIRIKKLPRKPMTVDEASLQLHVSDANFVVFRNSDNDDVNVLYIDQRGKVTLLEP